MKNIESNKRIDVIKTNTTPLATFKQGDKGVLVLELFRNGAPFYITGQTIILGAYRPNSTVVEQIDGFNIDNNILTINFKNSIFALPGLVELDLQLTDSEGEMTTSSFYIKVNKKVLGDDNLNASDEFNSLKQIKLDLTELNTRINRDENTRTSNENTRIEKERVRQNNEIERQNFYENTARPLVENLRDFDSQITENTNQINKAKTGFDGKEHSSLKRRLDAEYSEVKEQFNANSYLPFDGENITIENSLDGVTKDMEFRGKTLQNLFEKKPPAWEPTNKWWNVTNNVLNGIIGKTVTFINHSNKAINFQFSNLDNSYATQYIIPADGVQKVVVPETQKYRGVIATNASGWENTPVDKDMYENSFVILEGDWTNKEVPPYFQGIKSIAEDEGNKISILSTGKNVFSGELKVAHIEGGTNIYREGSSGTLSAIQKVSKGTYTVSFNNGNRKTIAFFSSYPKKNEVAEITGVDTITVDKDGYLVVYMTSESTTSYPVNIQIERGTRTTSYEPFTENKKDFLLNIEGGFKGLQYGISDLIYKKGINVLLEQNIDKLIANGNNNLTWLVKNDSENTILFYIDGASMSNVFKRGSDLICNSFSKISDTWNSDIEGVNIDGYCSLQIRILKTKLETQDIAGFKKWLQANPVTIYYQLATPVITELPISTIDFRTYPEKTHFMSLNKIPSKLTFKAPCDVPATISTLRTKNENLQQENAKLKGEVDTKTLRLHGQDVELTNSDLDLDFRIFELEMNIGLPINLNMKGMRSMARSPFEMMKILILNNNYDREDIEYKAKRYLQGGRMTQDEYDEIISLMDANELVK